MSNDYSPCSCNDAVSGISCKCENCEFHSTDDRCHAKGINIGPKNAENSHETVCGTFKCR